jgi:acetoin utilization deacetylase AcuC-like enzyme
MTRHTGFVWHEKFAWWDLGPDAGWVHPDGLSIQPDRHIYDYEVVRRFRGLIEASGLLDSLTVVPARPATDAELGRVHLPEMIQTVKDLSSLPLGGEAGNENSGIPRGGFHIAALAAGGAIAAAEAVANGDVHNVYALLRPAGHHSRPEKSMGLCIFSNAAIATRHLLERGDFQRVALVDWDVHHGNGTQAALWDEPRALTISIHQDGLWPPDDGFIHQTGGTGANGTNLNIPLPAGCATEAYLAAFDRVVRPALDRFQPDIIIVPSGFDAGHMDPMGRMMLRSDDYRMLTSKIMAAADELCGGKLVFLHEGGYSRAALPWYGLAVVEELSGVSTGLVDPFLSWMETAGLGLLPHQSAAVDAAAANLDRVPRPGEH